MEISIITKKALIKLNEFFLGTLEIIKIYSRRLNCGNLNKFIFKLYNCNCYNLCTLSLRFDFGK